MNASLGQGFTRRTADEWQPPHPLAALAGLLLLVLAVYIGAQQNERCQQWAGSDPDRVAACDHLNR